LPVIDVGRHGRAAALAWPLLGLTYPVNFSGHPAASIPVGMADGLPVGMQLIGRRYADADVLAAGAAFERLRPWRDHSAQAASG